MDLNCMNLLPVNSTVPNMFCMLYSVIPNRIKKKHCRRLNTHTISAYVQFSCFFPSCLRAKFKKREHCIHTLSRNAEQNDMPIVHTNLIFLEASYSQSAITLSIVDSDRRVKNTIIKWMYTFTNKEKHKHIVMESIPTTSLWTSKTNEQIQWQPSNYLLNW